MEGDALSRTVSILALAVSATTAWLTLFRRGRLQMTRPAIVFFGYDTSPNQMPKIFLRALLFSTAKRGHVIENMFVEVIHEGTPHVFSFWAYGDAKGLSPGSGLRVAEDGVVYNHHFLLSNNHDRFRFLPGQYVVRAYATTIYRTDPVLLSSIDLTLNASDSMAAENKAQGIMFDWEPQARRYYAHPGSS